MDVELKIPRSIAYVFTHAQYSNRWRSRVPNLRGGPWGPKPRHTFDILRAETAMRLQALRQDYQASLLFAALGNYKLIIGCQCRQEMGKIPNFTDSERFETHNTDCMLKFYKDKEFCQLGFQVCWPWKYKRACHLRGRLGPSTPSTAPKGTACSRVVQNHPTCTQRYMQKLLLSNAELQTSADQHGSVYMSTCVFCFYILHVGHSDYRSYFKWGWHSSV